MRPFTRAGSALLIVVAALAGCSQAPQEQTATFGQAAVAAPDLVEIGHALHEQVFADHGLALSPLPADATLTGPHHRVTLLGVVATEELTRDQLRALGIRGLHDDPDTPLHAGPGQEFLLVYFGEPQSGGMPASEKVTAAVEVAGGELPLRALPLPFEVLLLNVPAGADPTLVVTDVGRQAKISLRTGQRLGGDEEHPADLLQGDGLQLQELIRVPGLSEDPGEVLTVEVSVRPYSYLDDRGAPADGHMWLRLEFELQAITCSFCIAENATISLDLSRSLTVLASDGEELSIPSGTVIEPSVVTPLGVTYLTWHGFYEVPDTLRSFEVWYETHATLTRDDGGTWSYERIAGETAGTLELTLAE